jgi:GNAT superfamily N-acetyltransferase
LQAIDCATTVDLVPKEFQIRTAIVADASIISWHRARMFQDMGYVPANLFESFRAKSEARLRQALASGEYSGWLASPKAAPLQIIAGAGVQLRQTLPYPVGEPNEKIAIADGRQGIVLNVFTEPEWRRRGLARLLIEEIIAWARQQRLDTLALHASDDGLHLYEELGFVRTSEMELREHLRA